MGKAGEVRYVGSYTGYIEMYNSKEELSGESAICVNLQNGKTGYVPITENANRKSRLKILGADGKVYSASVVKKERYKDIVSCQLKLYVYNENGTSAVTYGSDFVQIKASGSSGYTRCGIYLSFYDDRGEDMNYITLFVDDVVPLEINTNAYITSSGSGNDFEFKFMNNQLITSFPSYLSKDLTTVTRYDISSSYNTNNFGLYAYVPNSSNVAVNKITFKSIKIAGREIPFTIVKK